MKHKIKLDYMFIKKCVLYVLLFALIGFVIAGIVSSFGKDHTYALAKIPEEFIPEGSYKNYLKIHSGVPVDALDSFSLDMNKLKFPKLEEDILVEGITAEISADAENFNYILADERKYQDNTGNYVSALETSDVGSATWEITIPEAGLYQVYVNYYPIKQGGSNIERKIIINKDKSNRLYYYFDNLDNVKFPRYWTDKSDIIQDTMGNDMKPSQVEILNIQRKRFLRDETGYIIEPYFIYFDKGKNTITFESIRESMAIVSIGITSYKKTLTYEEYLELHKGAKVQTLTVPIKIEGQHSNERTSPTLYAISDRTDPKNNPVDPVKIKLNAIGGNKWTIPGDQITWKIDMTNYESGFYYITLRAKQDSARGMFSTRRVYINGEIPFAEANACKFKYSSDYRMVTLGSEDEPFLFYLEGGKVNTISLEATLGDYASLISDVQKAIDMLNDLYLKIIAITTVNPDPYQDYYLYGENARIQGTLETLEAAKIILENVSNRIIELVGDKSDNDAVIDKMIVQLEKFLAKPRTITQGLSYFSNNISALGTWISNVRNQPLQVESIYVHSDLDQIPHANSNFFSRTWFGIKGFFLSFFFDYESIGIIDTIEATREVEVWFLTSASSGREQANAISTLITNSLNSFLEAEGKEPIRVSLKVVAPGVLLPSTLAGTGPDVAINVDNGLPVNYAMRNAIMDISVFDEFYEVTGICSAANAEKGLCEYGKDYNEGRLENPNSQYLFFNSAMVPYEFNGGYYALPNTQSFLVMFYRTDIFAERNWDIPRTWTEVTSLVRELSISNLQFYLPVTSSGASSIVNPIFATMLFQRGGTFYKDNGKASNFDSEEAMQAFEAWTKYYTDYSFPLSASFINRFRTGETPIGIAYYETFNTLSVSAPEIAGKWSFALLPGTPDKMGNINNSGCTTGTAITMMKNAKDPIAAWDFMRWWVSADTQTLYAAELESILGAAARHNSANVIAFKNLAWTKSEKEILIEQWSRSVGIPEVPGGYYTGRNLENAFREVVNNDSNPRETLQEYVITINSEITKKRKEFQLDVND